MVEWLTGTGILALLKKLGSVFRKAAKNNLNLRQEVKMAVEEIAREISRGIEILEMRRRRGEKGRPPSAGARRR